MARTKTAAPHAADSAAHAAPAPGPVPGTGPVPAGPAAAVQAALAARPAGATTAGIANATGIGRAAAGKVLAQMQTAGTAERTKGARPGIPDTWRPTAAPAASASPAADTTTADPADAARMAGDPTVPSGAPDEETASRPGTSDGDPGQDEHPDNRHPGDGTAAGAQDTRAEPGQDGTAGTAAPGDGDDDQHPDDHGGAEAVPDPAVAAAVAGHVGKIGFAAGAATTALAAGDLGAALAAIEDIGDQAGQARRTLKAAAAGGRNAPAVKPGALRDLVAAHLRAYPGKNFTPHQIGKKLTRSSGAVANALDKLVALGEAELATEKPRSFRLAGSPAADAASRPATAPDGDPAEDGDVGEPVQGAA